MASLEGYCSLEDYKAEGGDGFCYRVNVFIEIDGPSDYYVDVTDGITQADIRIDQLSLRDQKIINDWASEQVSDFYSDGERDHRDADYYYDKSIDDVE